MQHDPCYSEKSLGFCHNISMKRNDSDNGFTYSWYGLLKYWNVNLKIGCPC